MNYEIYTPENVFECGQAESIILSCTDGELCVLNDHLPLLASLTEGKIVIKHNGATSVFKSGSGCAAVKDNTLTIFVESCEKAEGDVKVIYKSIKRYKSGEKIITVPKERRNK